MDLSKLPKLSESPPPPAPTMRVLEATPRRISIRDIGVDLLIFVIVGCIFMMMGASFGGWLIAHLRGVPYATGWVWPAGHALENQPVDLMDLQGGTGWLYMGHWVLGVCLLIAGLVTLLSAVIPRLFKPLIVFGLLMCVLGAIANIVAVGMQIKMGFTQPILSMVGILVGGILAFSQSRHLSSSGTSE